MRRNAISEVAKQTILTVSVLTAGCLPFPHFVRTAPQVVGTISEGELPLAGTQVVLVEQFKECSPAADNDTTDAAGQFALGPTWMFVPIVLLLPGDPVTAYTVCIHDGQQLVPVSEAFFLGRPDADAVLRLDCKVTSDASQSGRTVSCQTDA